MLPYNFYYLIEVYSPNKFKKKICPRKALSNFKIEYPIIILDRNHGVAVILNIRHAFIWLTRKITEMEKRVWSLLFLKKINTFA